MSSRHGATSAFIWSLVPVHLTNVGPILTLLLCFIQRLIGVMENTNKLICSPYLTFVCKYEQNITLNNIVSILTCA